MTKWTAFCISAESSSCPDIDPFVKGDGGNEVTFRAFGNKTGVRCMLELAANNGDTCMGAYDQPTRLPTNNAKCHTA